MSAVPMSSKSTTQTLARKLWIAFRFVLFGVGGFALLWISMLALVDFSSPGERWMSPYFALPLSFVGALMMLFGAGEWGRWAYLFVFISTPFVMFLFFVIPWPKWVDNNLNKGSIVLIFVLPFILTYIAARRYYRRRDPRNDSATHKDLPFPVSGEQTSK
jgi:hypothetical protein